MSLDVQQMHSAKKVSVTVVPTGSEAGCIQITSDADQIVLSPDAFASLVEYVLTNTDLEPHDQRICLVERIRSMEVVSGFTSGCQRLAVL